MGLFRDRRDRRDLSLKLASSVKKMRAQYGGLGGACGLTQTSRDRASNQDLDCAQQEMLTTILILLALGGVTAECLYTPYLVRGLLYAGPLFLWE